MPKFGKRSRTNLLEAHHELQRLFNEVIKYYDCSIIEGYRSEIEQDRLFHAGKSKLEFPHSKHNVNPSLAVDVVPYISGRTPAIPWDNLDYFYHFIGYVKATADQLGIKVISGSDWNNNNDLEDQSFFDLPHWQAL